MRELTWKLGPSRREALADLSTPHSAVFRAAALCQEFETFPLTDANGNVEQVRARLLIPESWDFAKLSVERNGQWQMLASATCTPGAMQRAYSMWTQIAYLDQARREAIALANDLVSAQRRTPAGQTPHIERGADFASVYFPVAYVNGELVMNHRTTL